MIFFVTGNGRGRSVDEGDSGDEKMAPTVAQEVDPRRDRQPHPREAAAEDEEDVQSFAGIRASAAEEAQARLLRQEGADDGRVGAGVGQKRPQARSVAGYRKS